MSAIHEEKPPEAAKIRLQDLRNGELVSRLLAATPPYLYSAMPLPHAFFFSEMLRSFVTARNCRPYHRRFKRRPHKYFAENDTETWQSRKHERPEVPLELTVDKQKPILSPKLPKSESPSRPPSFVDVGTEELQKPSPCLGKAPEIPMTLPPPPPMWYPPVYNPQFGVDPMNLFIDLRVSGHIYDRKRLEENSQPEVKEPNIKKDLSDIGSRHRSSAFSVPVRSNHGQCNYGNDKIGGSNSTSYILKNLKSVYENIKSDGEKSVDMEVKDDSSDINDDDNIVH